MEISPVVCWLVAGLLLVGVDMLLGTFYLLVMGLAAGCGALAAWGGLSVGWQFSAFAVATIVGSLIVQRFRSAKHTESDALQQPDVGQNVTVKKWNDDGTTQVSYRGALWTAYTAQQSELSVGVWRIVRVEGTRLLIEPASY